MAGPRRPARRGPGVARRATLSARGARLRSGRCAPDGEARPFQRGEPASTRFTFDAWRRISWPRAGTRPATCSATPIRAGYRPLREAIAEYLGAARGVRCRPSRSSSSRARSRRSTWRARAARAGRRGLDGGPGLPGRARPRSARPARDRAGPGGRARASTCARGCRARRGARRLRDAVAPVPDRGRDSLARRLELLAWARERGAWIFEDDYDSEFRYAGRPLAALQGLDGAGRVLYVGSFTRCFSRRCGSATWWCRRTSWSRSSPPGRSPPAAAADRAGGAGRLHRGGPLRAPPAAHARALRRTAGGAVEAARRPPRRPARAEAGRDRDPPGGMASRRAPTNTASQAGRRGRRHRSSPCRPFARGPSAARGSCSALRLSARRRYAMRCSGSPQPSRPAPAPGADVVAREQARAGGRSRACLFLPPPAPLTLAGHHHRGQASSPGGRARSRALTRLRAHRSPRRPRLPLRLLSPLSRRVGPRLRADGARHAGFAGPMSRSRRLAATGGS